MTGREDAGRQAGKRPGLGRYGEVQRGAAQGHQEPGCGPQQVLALPAVGHDGGSIEEASQGRQEPGPQVDGGERLTPALGTERRQLGREDRCCGPSCRRAQTLGPGGRADRRANPRPLTSPPGSTYLAAKGTPCLNAFSDGGPTTSECRNDNILVALNMPGTVLGV